MTTCTNFQGKSFISSAPGKVILFGEHAVVYGRPAIAVPVTQVRVDVTVEAVKGEKSYVVAPLVDLDAPMQDLEPDYHLVRIVRDAAALLQVAGLEEGFGPAFKMTIEGNMPVAAGMGSGAAVAVATIRALAKFWGKTVSDEQVNALAYEIEKIHHGTPSGIDNTVVTYAQPVYFTRGQPIEIFSVGQRFRLLIADTGVGSSTGVTVGNVRKGWTADQVRYENMFDEIGIIVREARDLIESGGKAWRSRLGALMDRNQTYLEEMGVSSPELETLISAARAAGAFGAKLSGGGRGGNMIALVKESTEAAISEALKAAGAVRVISTVVGDPI